MATDRFLYWRSEKPSSKNELQFIFEDFLGDALKELEFADSRFIISLHGKPSYPFKRLKGIKLPLPDERWIEVFLHEKRGIDIITRQADEFTCVVADGLFELLKTFYQADEEKVVKT